MVKHTMDFFGTEITLIPIEEKSVYNDNYYEIKVPNCGDDFGLDTHGNNILYSKCQEDWGYYEYHIGHFEGDKFVPVISWDSSYKDLIEIDFGDE